MLTLFKRILFIICIGLFASCNSNSSVDHIPTSFFFKKFQKSAFHLSPNGDYVSYLLSQGTTTNIIIENTLNHKKIQITDFKIGGVKSYFWANNNTVFYVAQTTLGQQLYYVSSNGSINKCTLIAKNIDFIEKKLWDDRFFLLSIQNNITSYHNAYSMDIRKWKPKIISLNPGNIIKWKSDNNGKIRLAVASDGLNETILIRNTERDTFKALINSNFINTISPIKFTKNNLSIYALSNLGTDHTKLVTINCATGILNGVIGHTADVVDVGFKNNTPTQVELETVKREILYLNKDWKEIYFKLKKTLKTPHIKILESNESGSVYFVKLFSDINEDKFFTYNRINKTLVSLSEKDTIPSWKLCRMKPIKFTARDGFTLEGYLTLPKGDKYNLPCVVLPHSAPHGRDIWGYVPEVQFLANKGYAVLQVNYRGSSGYGKTFKVAGFKNWGKVMQNDITDGAKWLMDTKTANPKKIAIFGHSFGGFCALNAAFNHPEIYTCAASYCGINNLFSYMKDYMVYSKPYQQMLNQTIGNPVNDAPYFREISPMFNVSKIKVPLFIVQGTKDNLVSVNETNQFVKQVRKGNVNVKYLLNDTEGHIFTDNTNIIELYDKLSIFLKRNFN